MPTYKYNAATTFSAAPALSTHAPCWHHLCCNRDQPRGLTCTRQRCAAVPRALIHRWAQQNTSLLVYACMLLAIGNTASCMAFVETAGNAPAMQLQRIYQVWGSCGLLRQP
jgi:hypothetical protein